MDNHVHLILVPSTSDGLRAALGEAHRCYTRHVNFREGGRGYLFQGCFASYPMDDAHLMAAIRYVENNPVAAGLVARAEEWRWSSAASHIASKPLPHDPLTDVAALGQHGSDWQAMLRQGVFAAGHDPADETVAHAIEARLSTGRPLAAPDWIAAQEAILSRPLARQKPGPRAKVKAGAADTAHRDLAPCP